MAFLASRREFLNGALAVAAAGYASGTALAAPPAGTVLYVTLELGNPFFIELIDGLKSALRSRPFWHLEVRAGRKADDASGQLDIMESYLLAARRGSGSPLRGLIIDPAQSGPELAGMIARYNDAGIPVINTDIPIDGAALASAKARVASFVGSDNLAGGKKAADVMAERLPRGGEILVLLGAPGSANARNRRNGFVDRLTEIGQKRGTPFHIREWNCNWSASEASSATGSTLASGVRLEGIFAANDEMALGAAQAVGTASLGKRPKPVIIGYDATPTARKAIQEGRMYASISQNPHGMGEKAVEFLERVVSHLPVPPTAIVPVSVIQAVVRR